MDKTIMVVEDELSINEALTYFLNKEGFKVISTYSGEEALEELKKQSIDLVLLDIMLGGISGFDVCKEIYKETFVIMLTAKSDLTDKLIGLEIGADDYITKPFELKEVLARINSIFRRNNKEIKEEVNYGLIINKDRRIVIKDNREIVLRRKEFDILLYLYENKGIVLKREQILDVVWGYDFMGDGRAVDVHIRRLREALNEDKDNSIIETVFGIGYVIR